MDVEGIVTGYLKEHGYDGLVADDAECACIPPDLFPCGAPFETCCPGYLGPDPSGDYDWLIFQSRAGVNEAKQQLEEKSADNGG